MDCLTGFIGFESGTVEADSGLYLTALPGITADMLEGIKEMQETKEKALSNIEKRSILRFRTLFLNELNKCWNITDIDKAECLICANKPLLSVSLWYLMGAEMMAETIGSERTNRYTTVDLDKAESLRNEYMDIFFSELHTAVSGINVSVCLDNPIKGGDIQVIYAIP